MTKLRKRSIQSKYLDMASNQEYSQWDKLKEIVIEWLKNHPLVGIDDIFAHYLDPTDTIYRSYQVRSNSAIQVF